MNLRRDIDSPCRGCGERHIGCHDPAVCERWKEFLRRKDENYRLWSEDRKKDTDFMEAMKRRKGKE